MVGEDYTLAKSIVLLSTRGVSHAAVVDDEGVLVGVLSVKDVAGRVVEAFEEAGSVEQADLEPVLESPAGEAASKPPLVLEQGQGARLCEAALLMEERRVGFIPVVDGDGRLVGGFAELDAALELLSSDLPAARYATSSVVFADPDQPLVEALGFMLEQGFRRMPVESSGDYFMAFMASLLRAVLRRPRAEALVEPLVRYASPAALLDYGSARVSEAAELVLAVTERAVLLAEAGEAKAILTERDLIRAYLDEAGCRRR